jgi:hypothetical protein
MNCRGEEDRVCLNREVVESLEEEVFDRVYRVGSKFLLFYFKSVNNPA